MGLGPRAHGDGAAEAAKVGIGPFVLNARRPTRATCTRCCTGRTDEQKEKYLRPLCEGTARVVLRDDRARGRRLRPDADPDARLPRRRRVGHQRPQVVHLRRPRRAASPSSSPAPRTTPTSRRRRNTAFIVDLPVRRAGTIVRDVETMRGGHNHCEIRIEDLRVPDANMLGGRGQGHLLGQYRLGPARLAHCMRWIAPGRDGARHDGRPLARTATPRLAARREAGHPVDDRRLGDGAVPVQADGAARRVPDRARAGLQDRGVDGQALRRQHACGGSSTARSRCTARSATRPTRRSPTCSSRPAGPASPTAPTRSTRCASPSAPSPPTSDHGTTRRPPATSRCDPTYEGSAGAGPGAR